MSVLPEKLAYESPRPNEEASPRDLVPALDRRAYPGTQKPELAKARCLEPGCELFEIAGGGDHAHRREIFSEGSGPRLASVDGYLNRRAQYKVAQ